MRNGFWYNYYVTKNKDKQDEKSESIIKNFIIFIGKKFNSYLAPRHPLEKWQKN